MGIMELSLGDGTERARRQQTARRRRRRRQEVDDDDDGGWKAGDACAQTRRCNARPGIRLPDAGRHNRITSPITNELSCTDMHSYCWVYLQDVFTLLIQSTCTCVRTGTKGKTTLGKQTGVAITPSLVELLSRSQWRLIIWCREPDLGPSHLRTGCRHALNRVIRHASQSPPEFANVFPGDASKQQLPACHRPAMVRLSDRKQ
ncbi:hypothetical protein LZ30DRAFT_735038 [Colletotrichum cereale]|nr:hypothetical protein LZ30DRAFT_735038 [Colletotrichum cereale]